MSPLLNYTTEVPAKKTVLALQGLLVEAGARQILTQYDDEGNAVGLAFEMTTPYGQRQFALPVNSAAVQVVLQRQRVAPRYTTREHAERVAWRILKDWVQAQIAIIETRMVSLDQVMLPFMISDEGKTVFALYQERQLAALGRGDVP